MSKKKEDFHEMKVDLGNAELVNKNNEVCTDFIKNIANKTMEEKYYIVSTLYFSFLQACSEQGIVFKEINSKED